MRRQVSCTVRFAPFFSGNWLSPATFQMLPSHAETIATSPFSVKSNPVSRMRQNHGLPVGRFNTSTANGPSSSPRMASLVSTCGQRAGPPFVFFPRSGRGSSITTASVMAFAVLRFDADANQSVNRMGSRPAGIRNLRSPLSANHLKPETSPTTPATVRPLVCDASCFALPTVTLASRAFFVLSRTTPPSVAVRSQCAAA